MSKIRKWHRWLVIFGGVFFTYLIITGTSVALAGVAYGVRSNHSPDPFEVARADPSQDIEVKAAENAIRSAVRATLDAFPAADTSGALVELKATQAGLLLRVTIGGGTRATIASFDGRTGRILWSSSNTDRVNLDEFLQDIHAGQLWGVGAQAILLVSGLLLACMLATGAAMYIDMARKRFRSGKRNLFWS